MTRYDAPLPTQTKRELDLARILGGADSSEIGCAQDEARATKVRVIDQIEEVGAEGDIGPFGQSFTPF